LSIKDFLSGFVHVYELVKHLPVQTFFLEKKHLFKNIIQEKVERIIYAVFEVN